MPQWRIETPQSLDLEGVRRLEVRMVAGNVDVVGRTEDADSGAAQVEVSQLDGPLTVSLENGTLTIVHERLTWGGLLDWVGNNRRASATVSVSSRPTARSSSAWCPRTPSSPGSPPTGRL